MNLYQICARCGTRIGVGRSPQQWCPACHGVLLSPVPVGQAPTPQRRNFRWVASSPGGAVRRTLRRPLSPTPRYDVMPTWGLPIAGRPETVAAETAVDRLASRVVTLLTATAAFFVAAAFAEIARYAVLLFSRDRLVSPVVLAVSDASVWLLSFFSAGFGVVAAVAAVAWLVRARRVAYAESGAADPRSPRSLYLGSLIPVVNLVMPGVFLTEFARASEYRWRLQGLVPRWWMLWVSNWVLLAATVALRQVDGIQARANGVVLTAVTDLVAAATAVMTVVIIRRAADRTLRGATRTTTRWVIAPEPTVAPRPESTDAPRPESTVAPRPESTDASR